MAETLPGLAVPVGAPGSLDPATLFSPPPARVWLEVGFGAGEHLAALARAHPEIGFIGCEPYLYGVAALLRRLDEAGLGNVRIHVGDARDVLASLTEASLERILILFPDPWPKARHHKRRFIAAPTLDLCARGLAPGGELRVATDHAEYAGWIVEHLARHPAFRWTARGPADWRRRPADWPATRYEGKTTAQGRRPVFLRYRRVGRENA